MEMKDNVGGSRFAGAPDPLDAVAPSSGSRIMRRAPSIRSLCAGLKDIDAEKAKTIRWLWREASHSELRDYAEKIGVRLHHGFVDDWRYFRALLIDKTADYHGIEWLGRHRRTKSYVWFMNAGDPFVATLLFHGDHMYVGCWGDLVERNEVAP